MEDFNLPICRTDKKPSRLDPLNPVIDQWLKDDMKAPRKQRHTAKHTYDRLPAEYPQLLFQVITDCYEKRSIIITTNLEFSQWNGIFYDYQLTTSLIDRLVHHSHLIIFDRESWRFKHSLM